jgi:hypothetical protein
METRFALDITDILAIKNFIFYLKIHFENILYGHDKAITICHSPSMYYVSFNSKVFNDSLSIMFIVQYIGMQNLECTILLRTKNHQKEQVPQCGS